KYEQAADRERVARIDRDIALKSAAAGTTVQELATAGQSKEGIDARVNALTDRLNPHGKYLKEQEQAAEIRNKSRGDIDEKIKKLGTQYDEYAKALTALRGVRSTTASAVGEIGGIKGQAAGAETRAKLVETGTRTVEQFFSTQGQIIQRRQRGEDDSDLMR